MVEWYNYQLPCLANNTTDLNSKTNPNTPRPPLKFITTNISNKQSKGKCTIQKKKNNLKFHMAKK